MQLPTPALSRRASYWMLGVAFLVLGLYAVQQTIALQDQRSTELAEAIERDMERQLDLWEQMQMTAASRMLAEIDTAKDLDALQARYRQSPYFDTFYVWVPGENGPTFLHPPPYVEDTHGERSIQPCRGALDAAIQQGVTPLSRVLNGCADIGLNQTLFLATQAANRLAAEGRTQEAWDLLNSGPVPLELPLHKAVDRGIAPKRLMINRLLAAEIRGSMGDVDGQVTMLVAAAAEIERCNGKLLQELLPDLQIPIHEDLVKRGAVDQAIAVEAEHSALERHLAGYFEVRDRLSLRNTVAGSSVMESPTGATPSEPRVVIDQYGDQGYLLIYALLDENTERSIAIQLDPDALLDDLLRTEHLEGVAHGAAPLSIVDANGKLVRGYDPGKDQPDPTLQWIQVPFKQLFPHLRLAVNQAAVRDLQAQLPGISSQTLPIVIAFVLGVLAMAGRASADRQARDLYLRQQEFITRVTHELKTPLAGIRVMAETLELGMIHDAEKRERFLGRILQETERLGKRIDEVLKVTRRSQVVPKEKLSVTDLAEELARTWAPRFEQAGADLQTELEPTPPVLADRDMLRDALSNLLDNALKYLREDRPGIVKFRTHSEGRTVQVDVVDNGLGVPPAMRKRIFQAFTRVEGPGRGKAGGHGLGLSFVAETVRGHGGTVECREGIDGGARFVVRLRST